MIPTAIEAAHAAGQLIVDRFRDEHVRTLKNTRETVTEIDIAAEVLIRTLIRRRFAGHTVLGEEGGGEIAPDGYTWVIDPLDGTTNYAGGFPCFAVSIGILLRGEPVAGVVYDPLLKNTFVAERGCGATLNGAPISVNRTAILRDALVGMDWGHAPDARRQSLETALLVGQLCGTIRAVGSAVLGQTYVAAGWLDAYLNVRMKPWDAAAAMLIVKEAGGEYTTLRGAPFGADSPGCVASNGLVHQELLDALI
jgi:myo-inositol-1(or 4)-monophosphatase